MNNQINDDWQFNLEDFDLSEPLLEITEVKLIHHYQFNTDLENGNVIETSVEMLKKINNETGKSEWIKKITNVLFDLENKFKKEIIEEKINEPEQIIEKIQSLKLDSLKNNYFANEDKKDEYWEIVYNYIFKIVGSYKVDIEAFKIISNLLGFESALKDRNNMIETYQNSKVGDESYEI